MKKDIFFGLIPAVVINSIMGVFIPKIIIMVIMQSYFKTSFYYYFICILKIFIWLICYFVYNFIRYKFMKNGNLKYGYKQFKNSCFVTIFSSILTLAFIIVTN